MKKIITLLFIFAFGFTHAQAFKGKGDKKVNVGATFQDGGTGIEASADFGMGENLSFGFATSYVLGVPDSNLDNENFDDRYDARVRVSAHLGSVLKLDSKMDLYPGLDLSLKNFGGHVGIRYFFSEGIGVFSEAIFPIAKYDTEAMGYNNQFTLNLGVSFNL